MNKKQRNILIIGIIMVAVLVTGGSYAFWLWTSNIDKNVTFNTFNFKDYIVYNEGDSKFIGNFLPYDSFCQSANNTMSFYKKSKLNRDVFATIKMQVNSIGENIASSNDVYWLVTSGGNDITCSSGLDSDSVLAYGNFNGVTNGQVLELYSDIEVTITEQVYTVWIWIDSNGTNLSSLSGETVDTNIWTDFELLESNGGTGNSDSSVILTSYSCANGSEGTEPYVMTYTGDCEVIDDGEGDWRVKFLTDGTLTSNVSMEIDAFLVGGGGGGGGKEQTYGGGGGGGGYTKTSSVSLIQGTNYSIDIGDGGAIQGDGKSTSAFSITANGGKAGATVEMSSTNGAGGDGGSGGGGGRGAGGSDGSDGETGTLNSYTYVGGTGQGTTTREFGESNGTLYAGGGGGGLSTGGDGGGGNGGGQGGNGSDGTANTGGGGGGAGYAGNNGGAGGSGIVVIRNKRF